MSASSGAPPKKRAALGLQIKLPSPTREAALQRYGAELSRGLLFVRTPKPRAIETVVRLELLLQDGSPFLRAAAVVARVVEPSDSGASTALVEPGMELRFVAANDAGRALLAELGGPRLLPLKSDAFLTAMKGGEPQEPKSPLPKVSHSSAGIPKLDASAEKSLPPPLAKTEPPPVIPTNTNIAIPIMFAAETPRPIDAAKVTRKLGPIIGIDLGTSNSCAAVVREGKPRVIASREGYNTVPSVVALGDKGKLLVGHRAKSQLLINPENTVFGSKRLLGRNFDSPAVREVASRVPYAVVQGPRGEAAVRLGEKVLALQEISALILREVKELAERECEAEVTRAVITVPASYSDRQRQAVREAGILAGLAVERILSEPTAAALAFAHGRALEKRVLVYDLGGGTFDVSLLELKGNLYEVVSTGGDTFLGGTDFDHVLVESLLGAFQDAHHAPFPADRAALQRVTEAAERAKIALSEQLEVHVREPQIVELAGKRVDLDAVISRSELVMLSGHLVDRTLNICREVLAARGLSAKDVQEVLLVGGQSRMPLVRERIRNYFGREPSKAVHPDEAVALGAALFARELETGTIDGLVLIDVLPMDIGIGVAGGKIEPVIEHNTPVPHKQLCKPLIARDGQTSLELAIFQGDTEKLEEAEYLGTLSVRDLPAMQRGSAPIEVEIALDGECLLSASARDVASGRVLLANFAGSESPESVRERLSREEPFDGAAIELPAASKARKLAASIRLNAALAAHESSTRNPLADSGESEAVVVSNVSRAMAETAEMAPLPNDAPGRSPGNERPTEGQAQVPAGREIPAGANEPPARRGWLRGLFGKRR